MDPVFSASTPVPHAKRRSRRNLGNSDHADPLHFPLDPIENMSSDGQSEYKIAGKLPASLRRSTGLFNLKIGTTGDEVGSDNSNKPENKYMEPEDNFPTSENMLVTPNATIYGSRNEQSSISLKRPHPFSSAKSIKQSGFLARSSSAMQTSPQNSKRQHITVDIPKGGGALTPDLSFKGAKPVQTAFTSNGLQSKRYAPQTPKPRVPETPVKRSLANDSSTINSNTMPLDHGSPFAGSRGAASALGIGRGMESLSELETAMSGSADTVVSRSDTSRSSRTPIDRLERFSIGQIHSDDSEMPETPTRHGSHTAPVSSAAHTSTPLIVSLPPLLHDTHPPNKDDNCETRSDDNFLKDQRKLPMVLGAGHQASEAVTYTPGTMIKPMARSLDKQVLKSADPTDSMSLSPPESLEPSSFGDSMPYSPEKLGRDVLISSSSAEFQSSPKPRRRLRLFGLRSAEKTRSHDNTTQANQSKNNSSIRHIVDQSLYNNKHNTPQSAPAMFESGNKPTDYTPAIPSVPIGAMAPMAPPVPPLRVETPLGRTQFDLSPRTPGGQGFFEAPMSNSTLVSSGISEDQNDSTNKPKGEDSVLYDDHLASRFDKVQNSANGEFSCVYVVAQGKLRFAVKRTKKPMLGQRERARRREEIQILQSLSLQPNDSHVIQLIDEWEFGNFGYIMTEYCENGDLNKFLAAQGRVSRLEEWRVWKILVEVLHGLAVIHSQNILHLDLKPANVFVTFEGHLKIGDFGMATKCPPPAGFEREGDREYIAPEVLERHQYGKPADIFSVGLMMVEVAANIVLPDNGVHWHRLRSGDLSDAGRLSSGDLAMNMSSTNNLSSSKNLLGGLSSIVNCSEIPAWAPRFLVDDSCLLDKVVSLMLSPQPERRPTVAQLLTMPEMMLVYQRGQAGAIVYEGEFGPEPETEDEISVWQRA